METSVDPNWRSTANTPDDRAPLYSSELAVARLTEEVRPMGLEDALRNAQRAKDADNTAAARNAMLSQDRVARGNELLLKLGREALNIAQKRNHPRALEITSAGAKESPIGLGLRPKLTTGRTLWLLIPIHRWGESVGGYGVLDSGQLVRLRTAEQHNGRANATNIKIRKAIRSKAESKGLSAAVEQVEIVSTIHSPHFEQPNFFLNDAGELVFGTATTTQPADEFIARMMAG